MLCWNPNMQVLSNGPEWMNGFGICEPSGCRFPCAQGHEVDWSSFIIPGYRQSWSQTHLANDFPTPGSLMDDSEKVIINIVMNSNLWVQIAEKLFYFDMVKTNVQLKNFFKKIFGNWRL